jgi:hypothetical protein
MTERALRQPPHGRAPDMRRDARVRGANVIV